MSSERMSRRWARTMAGVVVVGLAATVPAALPADAVECRFAVTCPPPIYFSSNRSGNYEIYRVTAMGTQLTRMTSNRFSDSEPSPNRDRTQILFVSNRHGVSSIYAMNAAPGSPPRRLTTQFAASNPSFSPDGSRIAFTTRRSGYAQVAVMNADGTGMRELTTSAQGLNNREPAWSPDGTRIAFTSLRYNRDNVFMMNADGTGERNLLAFASAPTWSPDGGRLAVTIQRDGTLDKEVGIAYLSYLPNVPYYYATNHAGMDGCPSWSPDGSRIVYSSSVDGGSTRVLRSVKPDGSDVRLVTSGGTDNAEPNWGYAPLPPIYHQ